MPNPIFEQLKRYLSIPDPDYACMINGKWGSGKTYFLNDELEGHLKTENDDELKQLKIRYVSANGIKNFDDILDELKRQKILPQTNSKVKLVGKFAGRVIDNLPVGLIANVIAPGSGQTADKLVNAAKGMLEPKDISAIVNAVSFNEKDIIIIDDLERVHKDCDLIGLIGEINTEFVEHHNIKTILVCDESELEKRFNGENDRKLTGNLSNYKGSKEKCVRYTYRFTSELKPILESIISNTSHQKLIKEFLLEKENVDFILSQISQYKKKDKSDLSTASGISNIRVIKHIVEVLSDIIDVSNIDRIRLIFSQLVIFVIDNLLFFKYFDPNTYDSEQRKGVSRSVHYNQLQGDQKDIVSKIYKWILSEYDLITPSKLIFESPAIRNYISAGLFDKDLITKDIESQIKVHKLDKPEGNDLKQFIVHHRLEDNEFRELNSRIIDHLKNNRFSLSQSISLIKVIRALINRGCKFQCFTSNKTIAEYFIKYLKGNHAECITTFMAINDIKAELQIFKEDEYAHFREKIIDILDSRQKELNIKGLHQELDMVIKGTRDFDENILLKLISSKEDTYRSRIYNHYINSNEFKHKFYLVSKDPFNKFDVHAKKWVKDFCDEALAKLPDDSLGKLLVKSTLNEIENIKDITEN